VVVPSTTSESVNRASSSLTHPACLTSVYDIQVLEEVSVLTPIVAPYGYTGIQHCSSGPEERILLTLPCPTE
jgi:hypothetical protein